MSGPKTSKYTLTAERRRILAEQRRIERRKAVAYENIKRRSADFSRIGIMFTKDKVIADELISRNGDDNGFNTKLANLSQLLNSIMIAISDIKEDNVDTVEALSEQADKALSDADKLIKEISYIAEKNRLALRADLEASIALGFSSSFDESISPDSSELIVKRETCRKKLLEMANMSGLPAGLSDRIKKALAGLDTIDDFSFLTNYIAITVSPLLKECHQYSLEYEKYHDEFKALHTEYTALCALYNLIPQGFTCSKESIDSLKIAIEQINVSVAADDEQAYISKCIDETMEEMGYNVLGSRHVTKKSGKHFHHELFSYGDGTAVNVTYSSDGRIAIELGGLDTVDRIPTEQESSHLCDEMERFCDDFKEIEKRLLEKGVVMTSRVAMLPPVVEYTQIINTSDYNMNTDAGHLYVKKRRNMDTASRTMKE